MPKSSMKFSGNLDVGGYGYGWFENTAECAYALHLQ